MAGILAACLLAVHAVLVLLTPADGGVYLTKDSLEYLAAAGNLHDHGILYAGDTGAPPSAHLYSWRTPLYPFLLFVLQFLSRSLSLVLLFQLSLTYISGLLIARVLREVGVSCRYRWGAAAVFAFSPVQVLYTRMVMTEVLLQFELLVLLVLVSRTPLTPVRFLWFSVFLSLAVLTKPVMVFLWIANVLLGIHLFARTRIPAVLVYALIPAAVIAAWSWRNAGWTGSVHYSSISGVTLRNWNVYHFLQSREGGAAADDFLRRIDESMAGRSFGDQLAVSDSSCLAAIGSHPWEYALFHLRGSVVFFLDPGRFDISRFSGMDEQAGFLRALSRQGLSGVLALVRQMPPAALAYLVLMVVFNAVLAIGFVRGVACKGVLPATVRLFSTVVVLYVALATGPLGASRFRVPVLPFLIIATVAAIPRSRRADPGTLESLSQRPDIPS